MFQTLKTLCLINFWGWKNSPFPLLTLWGNKNWPPQYENEKVGKFPEQKGLKGMQMVQFECSRHLNNSHASISKIRTTDTWQIDKSNLRGCDYRNETLRTATSSFCHLKFRFSCTVLHLFQSSLSSSRRHKTHFDIMWRHDFFSGPHCIWRVPGSRAISS